MYRREHLNGKKQSKNKSSCTSATTPIQQPVKMDQEVKKEGEAELNEEQEAMEHRKQLTPRLRFRSFNAYLDYIDAKADEQRALSILMT